MSNGNLIIVENGHLEDISLEGKNVWEVGRATAAYTPDIRLHTKTVSRRHGQFTNRDGFWAYRDYNSKNGTMCNNKILKSRTKPGESWPVYLNEGDTLVFGSRGTGLISPSTVWATFTMKRFPGGWRVMDTKNMVRLLFVDGDKYLRQEQLARGTVLSGSNGMAIYMGDLTYLTGNVHVEEVPAG